MVMDVPHDYKDSKMSVDVKVKSEEKVKMSEKNDFLESLKVDQKTQEKLNEVLKNYNNSEKKTAKKADDGGRERGDEGPGKLGRDSGLKSGSKVAVMRADMKANNSMNQPKGQLSQNGQAVVNSGQAASSNPAGQTSSGQTGIGSNTGCISGNSGANGGHGSTGGISGGTGGGHGGSGGTGGHGGH